MLKELKTINFQNFLSLILGFEKAPAFSFYLRFSFATIDIFHIISKNILDNSNREYFLLKTLSFFCSLIFTFFLQTFF